jgi:hypothetical protein
VLRVHFIRLLESPYLYFSILIGIIITTFQYILSLGFLSYSDIPMSSYLTWLSSTGFNPMTSIFLLILPILAALPYGAQLRLDVKTGYFDLSIHKSTRGKYYTSIYLINAFAGFFVILVPVTWNFLLHSLTYKAITPNPMLYYSHVPESRTTLFYHLFFNFPVVNTIIYILLFGLVGSVMATLALSSGFFAKNKLIIFSIPFVFQLFLSLLPSGLFINPQDFLLSVSISVVQLGGVIKFFLVTLFLTSIVFFLGKIKYEK